MGTMNNQTPDFEKLATEECKMKSSCTYIKCGPSCINDVPHDFVDHRNTFESIYKSACQTIWNDYVLPEKQKSDELLEALINMTYANLNDPTWDYPSAFSKAVDVIAKYSQPVKE